MRDILYKNLTSNNKKRKIISSSEILDKDGFHYIIHRHFVYMVREIDKIYNQLPQPYMYVYKEKSSKNNSETFFCRLKRSIVLSNDNQLFLVNFMHSLKINLTASSNATSQ
ncbi:MAG: hypothetical protein ABIG46_04480 [Candidatus Omnitrophota bacterium]|nr:hypothetical protein [Candidatus Omnitrophota bacterium]